MKLTSSVVFDNFTSIPFSSKNLDRFYLRSAIFNSFKENIHLFKGKLLDVGCGQMPYRKFILDNSLVNEYIGLDIDSALEYNQDIKPDVRWDGIEMPFKDNQFNTVILTEVLEHTPDPITTLKESFRVLKNEGILFLTVPFLWPLHEVPNDEYRYTPFSLKKILEKAGFNNIEIKATGGWHASLAQMLGLWVRRSNLSKRKRNLLSIILKPIIKFLISKDNKPTVFLEGQMITGLYGTAQKII